MNPNQIVLEDFIKNHPSAAARTLDMLDESEVAEFIQELPVEQSVQLLNLMKVDKVAKCIVMLPPQLTKRLIEDTSDSMAESLCRHFEEPFRKNLLDAMSPKKSTIIKLKLEQIPNTVGTLMVPAVGADKKTTVADAIEQIRRNEGDLESNLYVVDLEGVLKGVVRLKQLLLADKNSKLEELNIRPTPNFFTDTPIKKIFNHNAWYENRHVPVINRSKKLLGTLSYKAIMNIRSKDTDNSTRGILQTGSALGELYLIGLTGLLQSAGKQSS
ncbi:hypothetical protein HME9304_02850 [Flagellimonas maritima]|uniref:Magnesium transporter n=1 Tax=Flagellimonas maritima TaxID=1383885 RepID=A0A2Z4LVU8_9FLAO|nr:CBS domain-containing protein [Allomuricauda aurantiaca]AWX45820.1 hypothetical protein HME9304_02850 [Allomuricauda aurantiaca]